MSKLTSTEIVQQALYYAWLKMENDDSYVKWRFNSKQKWVTTDVVRETTEGQEGQILAWTAEELKESIDSIVLGVDGPGGDTTKIKIDKVKVLCTDMEDELWIKWKAYKGPKKMSDERKKLVSVQKVKAVKEAYPGHYVAPAAGYRTIADYKTLELGKKIAALVEEALGIKDKTLSKLFSSGIHIGHGAYGSTSVAQNVAMQQRRIAEQSIDESSLTAPEKKDALSELDRVFTEANQVFKTANAGVEVKQHEELDTQGDWKRIWKDDGSLAETHVQILTLQLGTSNTAQGREIEENFNRILKNNYRHLIEAGPNPRTDMKPLSKEIGLKWLERFAKALPPNMGTWFGQVPRTIKKRQQDSSKSRNKVTGTEKVKVNVVNPMVFASKKEIERMVEKYRKEQGVGGDKSTTARLLKVQALLNARLSGTVRENMGTAGALVNRTGRFADNVSAPLVARTTQGGVSIGYTYMQNPYQVFEKNPKRDPRKLISSSIRELVQGQIDGRFFIRRL